METPWSVAGAIAVQSAAHNRLERALAENRAVEIWQGDCHITTCASMEAARMWVGKSKRYTIKEQA